VRRLVRIVATLVVTGAATAYVLTRIDPGETARTVAAAHLGYLAGSLGIMLVTVLPMAWRWQLLLRARGVGERLPWLVRAYLVSYTAGQFLPTAVGGDAMRIFEGTRRHPGRGGEMAGSVLLERALGGTATLALAGVGFALAYGRYDVGAYLWIQGAFAVGAVVLAFLFFSRAVQPALRLVVPLVRPLALERPLRALYSGIHAYRAHGRLLAAVALLTLGLQAIRVLAIWLAAEAAGVDVEARVYYVMGPLLFLVMLVPFTVNGLAVREAFFVSFLGTLGVAAEPAFAAGFLFFVVTIALALPGGVILLVEAVRRSLRHRPPLERGERPQQSPSK
jgi:glycosyltransferase 2 family protein